MAGRIETYVHSDSYTANKGGCLVKVMCKSDAAANTDEFAHFCKEVAKYAYGVGEETNPFDVFPELADLKLKLEKLLKENVSLERISIMKL